MTTTHDDELPADQTIRKMVAKANMLKDYSYTPQNVVLITVDDIVEIMHEVVPYTMSKLDESYDRLSEVNLKSQQQENEGGVVTMIVKTDDEVPTNIVRTDYPDGHVRWSKVTPTKENDRV